MTKDEWARAGEELGFVRNGFFSFFNTCSRDSKGWCEAGEGGSSEAAAAASKTADASGTQADHEAARDAHMAAATTAEKSSDWSAMAKHGDEATRHQAAAKVAINRRSEPAALGGRAVRNARECPECGGAMKSGECEDCGYEAPTRNAADFQGRHLDSGQYLHAGGKAGTKQVHAAAQGGHADLTAGQPAGPDGRGATEVTPTEGHGVEADEPDDHTWDALLEGAEDMAKHGAQTPTGNALPPFVKTATKKASIASIRAGSKQPLEHAEAAHAAVGAGNSPVGDHLQAAATHDDVAEQAAADGEPDKAAGHADAAALHRKAAELHRIHNRNRQGQERTENRGGDLPNMTRQQLEALVANCTCANTRNALLALRNAKTQGSNSDETGNAGFDASVQSGGEEDSPDKHDEEYEEKVKTQVKGSKGAITKKGDADATANAAQQVTTAEQWLQVTNAPESVRGIVANALRAEAQAKGQLVARLVANVSGDEHKAAYVQFLSAKPLDELRAIYNLARAQPRPQDQDYQVNRGGQAVPNALNALITQPDQPAPLYLGQAAPLGNAAGSAGAGDPELVLETPTINYRRLARANANGGRVSANARHEDGGDDDPMEDNCD